MEENQEEWIVEMRQPGVSKGQIQATSAKLFELASYVKGYTFAASRDDWLILLLSLVDMQVLDHSVFQNKIQYKNT